MRRHLIYILLFWILEVAAEPLPFRLLPSINMLPTDEVHCLYRDRQGLLWIGTSTGLKSYNGYDVHTYKSDAITPSLLPNNNILCITEDRLNHLWLGTGNGLVRMDQRTGEFRTYNLPSNNQRTIYTLTTGHDGIIWIGTDGGLTRIDPNTDQMITFNKKNTRMTDSHGKPIAMHDYSVKSILDDGHGHLFVGTWYDGLLRLDLQHHTFVKYPWSSTITAAYSLFMDSRKHLWVGTWGGGMIRLDHPYDAANPGMTHYPYIPRYFDTYYKIKEDPTTHTLLACSRDGISLLRLDKPMTQWQHYTTADDKTLNFCNDILVTPHGDVWIATASDGIVHATTQPSLFRSHVLSNYSRQSVDAVLSLTTNDGRLFWMGLRPYGLAYYDRQTGSTSYGSAIPGFGSLPPKVMGAKIPATLRRANGELWFASASYGIIIRYPNGTTRLLNSDNTPFLHDNYVCTLFEDHHHRVWIGERSGLAVAVNARQGQHLSLSADGQPITRCDVRGITEDHKGTIWVSTDDEGIIAIDGNVSPAMAASHCVQFSPRQGTMAVNEVTACLEDHKHRLWAVSPSGGLFLYDNVQNCFVDKNRTFDIHGDQAYAIAEDKRGNLWITTEEALIALHVHDSDNADHLSFTASDGIEDMLFVPNGIAAYGDSMYVTGRHGFISFSPTELTRRKMNSYNSPLLVTDLLIDGEPYAVLDSCKRRAISAYTPPFTREITIPHGVKKIGVQVSLLSYRNMDQCQYAFMLKGYDDEWVYSSDRQVVYQNLPSGTYRLCVRAANSMGQWQSLPYELVIHVRPAWYATWWAMMLWLLIACALVWACVRWYKQQLVTRNRLQMDVIFTNITHELLTPLTVISATIDEMRTQIPAPAHYYEAIQYNISHVTRLLRQILEVRKSQAGQLRLRVSQGNLSEKVESICRLMRPMGNAHHNPLTVNVPKQPLTGWFDPDKMEKILNNLLSNAFKYNREGGNVTVTLQPYDDGAQLTVSDEGIGMTKKQLNNLYTRFLDGDYRAMNTHGTGIGLSLVRDLVRLHHGTINCKSEEGQGTTFAITIPLEKRSYPDTEIDDRPVSNKAKKQEATAETVIRDKKDDGKTLTDNASQDQGKKPRKSIKILLVEDNLAVLNVLSQLLNKDYNVRTARNGQQAWNIIQREDLDLVISDVMMPVMNGRELTRLIKKSADYAQLPVILLTAKTGDSDRDEGYSSGADAYITKPFRYESLKVRIDNIIGNRVRIKKRYEQQAVQSLENNDKEMTQQDNHLSSPDQLFLEKAKACVMKHLNDSDFDRESFAREMLVSSSTLYNKLRAITGMTVIEYINNIRLDEARRIHEAHPDITISELAARTGFNTPKYFSRLYKKRFGEN